MEYRFKRSPKGFCWISFLDIVDWGLCFHFSIISTFYHCQQIIVTFVIIFFLFYFEQLYFFHCLSYHLFIFPPFSTLSLYLCLSISLSHSSSFSFSSLLFYSFFFSPFFKSSLSSCLPSFISSFVSSFLPSFLYSSIKQTGSYVPIRGLFFSTLPSSLK